MNLAAQIKSYNQSVRNANDALNVVQTADSALNESQDILTRLRELASQSASSGVSNTERGYIQNEVDGLISEIDRIANATEFNGVSLLNTNAALTFQVGIRNVAANDQIVVTTSSATVANLGLSVSSLATITSAQGALGIIDTAMQSISSTRATLGAQGNRMEKAINAATSAAVSHIGRREPHPRRRRRRGDLEHEPEPGAAAGRRVGARAGEPAAAGRAQAPERLIRPIVVVADRR